MLFIDLRKEDYITDTIDEFNKKRYHNAFNYYSAFSNNCIDNNFEQQSREFKNSVYEALDNCQNIILETAYPIDD